MKTRRNNCSSRKGCGCGNKLFGKIGGSKGGYKPTKKNLETLRRWRRGESIGFTATSSLKAKGLIPRTSRALKGKKVVSAKYKGGGCGCSGNRNVAPMPTGLWK
jgi:hypothetical protein